MMRKRIFLTKNEARIYSSNRCISDYSTSFKRTSFITLYSTNVVIQVIYQRLISSSSTSNDNDNDTTTNCPVINEESESSTSGLQQNFTIKSHSRYFSPQRNITTKNLII